MQTQSLTGLRVLVTRPVHQQESFNALLREAGAIPIAFPLIEISGPDDVEAATRQLAQLSQSAIIIFVSPNAVSFANRLQPLPWTKVLARFAAIGDATARSLLHYGQGVDIVPVNKLTSEELLALPDFADVRNKTISVIGGDIGRSTIQDELTKRGARVEKIIVYRNRTPTYTITEQTNIFVGSKPHVVCITSNQGILNLTEIMDVSFREQLLNTPLIVNSERCSKLARSLGFNSGIVVASKPGDQGQLDALRRWASGRFFNHSERDHER
ncbi:MAG: uroporphyrinogen-III synthase [Gammaproteobacteria bacterium]|nr:uroporphyrinogen-III synthase [Gammaproteobacteria bacterium]